MRPPTRPWRKTGRVRGVPRKPGLRAAALGAWLGLGLGLALAVATPLAAERLPVERTAPGHLQGLPRLPGSTAPPAVPPPSRRTDWPVFAFEGRVRDHAAHSAELSAACRRGAFRQRLAGAYRARSADDRPHGIGFGTGINLHDPERRAAPDLVYFFDRQDTGRCAVYFAPFTQLRPYLTAPWAALVGPPTPME